MWRFSRSPKWLVPSLPLCGRGVLGHVLRENVARRDALDEESTDVADHRSHPVALFKRVGGADGDGFLAEAGVEAADDFVLAEEPRHGVFHFTIEPHVVVEVEVLRAGKFFWLRGSFRDRHRECSPNRGSWPGSYLKAKAGLALIVKRGGRDSSAIAKTEGLLTSRTPFGMTDFGAATEVASFDDATFC